jgi:alcohol dehydrogenase/benzil reductase ((S)-benzoin forming)
MTQLQVPKTILITGASGYIGKNFVNYLLEFRQAKYNLVLLTRDAVNLRNLFQESSQLKIVQIDLHQSPLSIPDFDFDAVLHLAAKVDFFANSDIDRYNNQILRNLVAITEERNLNASFVFASTWGAVDRHPWDNLRNTLSFSSEPNPTSLYGKGKLQDENFLRNSSLKNVSVVRIPWVYGPGMKNHHIKRLLKMGLQNSLVSRVFWPGKVTLISVSDLCEQFEKLLDYADSGFREIHLEKCFNTEVGTILRYGILARGKSRIQLNIPKSVHQLLYFIRGILPFTLRSMLFDVLISIKLSAEQESKEIVKFGPIIRELNKEMSKEIFDVVVTGCSSGLGLAISQELYTQGHNIIGVDIRSSDSHQLFTKFVKFDLTNLEELKELPELLFQGNSQNKLILINNAGVCVKDDDLRMNSSKFHFMTKLNFLAPLILLSEISKWREVFRVVNISSSSSLVTLREFSYYGATKSALQYISHASEDYSENYTLVIPSGMDTPMFHNTTRDSFKKRSLNPSDVARKIVQTFYKKSMTLYIGKNSHLTMLISRIFSHRAAYRLFSLMVGRYK